MPDCQSIHLKALDSADLSRLRGILNVICSEAGEPLRGPAMQRIAVLLIGLYRHGVTDDDKLLSVGRLALTQKAPAVTAAVISGVRKSEGGMAES
ncbi:hypothetical protein [Rhizobium phaseoli]|uniref:Hypothetical conserved protein n=1 Tax=Rhizobium etli (strain CIAT 652) TaxID=491916 RepID=B3Q4K0_RHIE6|nr:hypothetical protein [Rhizobium phaseoli]ACE94131.1 hypothetical conserved protein [Rhizobium etli CIAT 652]MDK4730478.1 hypothetical protein [Rhizobium phaseoli]NKE90317.1 hypothetical protein [Rhizobium phaseoli]PDS68758.1 hypothetical protein CO651_27505 [Rhizobium phaseoli]